MAIWIARSEQRERPASPPPRPSNLCKRSIRCLLVTLRARFARWLPERYEPVRIWHLLTHTAGLTYGFHRVHPVDTLLRQAGYEWSFPQDVDLAAAVDTIAGLPLLFQPGTEWNYGVSTDVLGRVVEVISGQSLDQFFDERIFTPLGMDDTAFFVDENDADRVAALYTPDPATGKAMRLDLGRTCNGSRLRIRPHGTILGGTADHG